MFLRDPGSRDERESAAWQCHKPAATSPCRQPCTLSPTPSEGPRLKSLGLGHLLPPGTLVPAVFMPVPEPEHLAPDG